MPIYRRRRCPNSTILGGKVYIYKRPKSSLWQCCTYLAGKNRRISTKEESLAKAKGIAEYWYLKLRGKLRSREIKAEKWTGSASTCAIAKWAHLDF